MKFLNSFVELLANACYELFLFRATIITWRPKLAFGAKPAVPKSLFFHTNTFACETRRQTSKFSGLSSVPCPFSSSLSHHLFCCCYWSVLFGLVELSLIFPFLLILFNWRLNVYFSGATNAFSWLVWMFLQWFYFGLSLIDLSALRAWFHQLFLSAN